MSTSSFIHVITCRFIAVTCRFIDGSLFGSPFFLLFTFAGEKNSDRRISEQLCQFEQLMRRYKCNFKQRTDLIGCRTSGP